MFWGSIPYLLVFVFWGETGRSGMTDMDYVMYPLARVFGNSIGDVSLSVVYIVSLRAIAHVHIQLIKRL